MTTYSSELILDPVIEIEPYDWAGNQYHKKIGTDEWPEYWDRFLSNIGLQPIYSGSWFVSTDQFREKETLKKLVHLCLNESGIPGFPDADGEETDEISDRLMPFSGGYILRENEKIYFEPQCCCDLGDIEYWRDIATCNSNSWQNVAMGHGLMDVSLKNNKLILKETPEYTSPHPPIIEEFNPIHVASAIDKAKEKIVMFDQVINPVVFDILNNRELANCVSRILSGLRL